MESFRLLCSLVLPSLLVAWGMEGAGDVRLSFALYVLGGCLLGPWLLLGVAPFRDEGGFPFAARDGRDPRRAVVLWTLFGPLFLGVYALLHSHLGDPAIYRQTLVRLRFPASHPWLAAGIFVAVVPLVEEWWWRGQALPRCQARFGSGWGLVMAASGFALYHLFVLGRLYPPVPALLRWGGILLAGLLWCGLAARWRSWRAVWWAHLGAEMAVAVALRLYVFR